MEYKNNNTNTKKNKHLNKRNLSRSIEERGKSIDTREEFGHCQIDTVIGSKSKKTMFFLLS
jgi:transposase, IS30 family